MFGKEAFGGGAEKTLLQILPLTFDREKTYFIGGYSLSALFARWSAFKTDVFSGVAAASPSAWFPGFAEFVKNNGIGCKKVYLSIGDREEKAKNPVTATVGVRLCEIFSALKEKNVDCALEYNEGNHFKDADVRTAKAFAWLINRNLNRSEDKT